jgi:cobyric acid synthase
VIKARTDSSAAIRIAVPRLPRVSNFTDLDAFAADGDVSVSAVSSGDELMSGSFDAVVIPGTKSTVADLGWLRESGLADAIQAFARAGGAVAGICGGYQMMGERIDDPLSVESQAPSTAGLGLLPIATEFSADKKLSRTTGVWAAGGYPVSGYEIHHGESKPSGGSRPYPVMLSEDGGHLGYGDERIWGSYLHGVFDSDPFRSHYLNRLRNAKGLPSKPASVKPTLDAELGRLAEAVKANVDMHAIRKALGL